jgi:murein L,D-transpeptidase YcbB/YkuD
MRKQPAPFLDMRVIVGKAFGHQTPVFADYMRYLIFRPYWEVPMSIQLAELVPKIRRDRDYLADRGFEVTTSSGTVITDGTVTDDILSELRSGSLTIRQKPGPKNALGLVKFIFPNHYDVYLHSTPEPELFLKARRDFSHGCIRVQHPAELAAWVLRDKPEWSLDKINATMNGDQTVEVHLDKPIPVLILYTSAVVEPDGMVHFFGDIYGQDSNLDKALANGYPYPAQPNPSQP